MDDVNLHVFAVLLEKKSGKTESPPVYSHLEGHHT